MGFSNKYEKNALDVLGVFVLQDDKSFHLAIKDYIT